MESIHVRQIVRPIRFGFIVARDDHEGLRRAISLNTALWGGIYNLIVPIEPIEERNGLLKTFDPEYLVHISGDLSPEFTEEYKFRIIPYAQVVAHTYVDNLRHLKLGVHIGPLLRKIHDEEIRFLQQTSRATVVRTSEPRWGSFIAAVYGSFDALPELDFDLKEGFTRALRATELVTTPDNVPSEAFDCVAPIDVTRYNLSAYGGSANFSTHIVYVGDPENWTDLVEFWNIRATGRRVMFLPVEDFGAFELGVRNILSAGDYAINPTVRNHSDMQKGPGITDEQFERVANWAAALGAGPVARRTWRPRFGMEMEFYVGDIHAARVEFSRLEEVALWDGERLTPIKSAQPEFLANQDVRKGDHRWAIEISLRGSSFDNSVTFSYPAEPGIKDLARRMIGRLPGELHVGRNGLVVTNDAIHGHLYLAPLKTSQMFEALFEGRGFDVEESLPGRYAAQIINKMGHLHFDCRIFKIRGVREIINRLSNGSILTKGNMFEIVKQNWDADKNDDLIVHQGQASPLKFGPIFNELLEKRIIRPGFVFKCQNCYGEDWYHVSEFAEEFTCRLCFTKQRVDFGAKHEWQYKSDGLFQVRDSALGSLAVIVALWRFAHVHSMDEGKYFSSVRLKDKESRKEYEIDFAYMQMNPWKGQTEIVFGEAAGFIELTEADAEKMRILADRFDKRPYLAFATLRDQFSDTEKTWLRKLSADGYKVIALTRNELDPYDLFRRFEHARHKYAVNLTELSENTLQLNVQEPQGVQTAIPAAAPATQEEEMK